MFKFECAGMRIAQSVHKAVAAEVVIVGCVAVVAAECEPLAPRILLPERLIDEIPHKPALHRRIFGDEIPILLHSAVGIAHRMGVFAEDERLFGIVGDVLLAS